MTTRYWVVGGEYEDCRLPRARPGTEKMVGPFEDERKARNEWIRLTYCPTRRRDHPLLDRGRDACRLGADATERRQRKRRGRRLPLRALFCLVCGRRLRPRCGSAALRLGDDAP